MKRKVWIFLALVVVIIAQLTVVSSAFHSFQTEGITYGNSIVEISKFNYVSAWAMIQVSGASQQYPVTLQFSNGSQTTLTSPEFSFKVNLPRTGDCFCNGAGGLYQTNVYINQSQPIAAAIVVNASSFAISGIPNGMSEFGGLFDTYWFVVSGDASVFVSGHGVAY